MAMQAFTPVYLQREHTAPALLQSTDDGTTYNSMNEWLPSPGRSNPIRHPMHTWTNTAAEDVTNTAGREEEEECDEDKHLNLPRPRGPEDYYKRVYDDLTKQIAYRWPNPGTPRHREGCIGGTWRHIKEVLGHGGSRFVFVDGLVSVYDDQKFTQKLQTQLPYRPHIKPLYAPIRASSPAAPTRSSLSSFPVLPKVPAASMAKDPNVQRKLQLQERFPNQRRGFYGYP